MAGLILTGGLRSRSAFDLCFTQKLFVNHWSNGKIGNLDDYIRNVFCKITLFVEK